MFGMLSPILKNGFGKPATRMYPFVTREAFDKARGKLEIDIDKCIFCGMCQRKCPSTCLSVDKATCKWELNPFNCVICGVCVEACPTKCLSLNKIYRAPVYVKENQINIGKPPVKKTAAPEKA